MGAKQTPQLAPLTEAQIRQQASAESFARGAEYEQRGAVGTLILRGEQLHAEVEGSEYEPYRVTVSFDRAGVRTASCTCPYDWGGWCKHIVATLLAFAAQPGDVERRLPLAELLAGLNRDQLVAVLLHLAEDEPALVDAIEAQLVPKAAHGAALAQLPAVATAAPAGGAAVASGGVTPTRRTAVDVEGFKRQLRRVFRSQRIDDYLAYEGILADLEPLVAQIRGFLGRAAGWAGAPPPLNAQSGGGATIFCSARPRNRLKRGMVIGHLVPAPCGPGFLRARHNLGSSVGRSDQARAGQSPAAGPARLAR
jgi:hypothetical protein